MKAIDAAGSSLEVGQVVYVLVHPYRTWGKTVREDLSADPIAVEGTINSITFTHNIAKNLVWTAEVVVNIPVTGGNALYPNGVFRIATFDKNACGKDKNFLLALNRKKS